MVRVLELPGKNLSWRVHSLCDLLSFTTTRRITLFVKDLKLQELRGEN